MSYRILFKKVYSLDIYFQIKFYYKKKNFNSEENIFRSFYIIGLVSIVFEDNISIFRERWYSKVKKHSIDRWLILELINRYIRVVS